MSRKNKLQFAILFLLVGVGMLISYANVNSLERNAKQTTATVYDLVTSSKSTNIIVKYSFVVEGKKFNNQDQLVGISDVDYYNSLRNILIGQTFPAVYDSTDFENSQILIMKEDYKLFNTERPGDLNEIFLAIDNMESKSKK